MLWVSYSPLLRRFLRCTRWSPTCVLRGRNYGANSWRRLIFFGLGTQCCLDFAGAEPTISPPRGSGNSSVGRASPCQGEGREFESPFPLQFCALRGRTRHVRSPGSREARWQNGHAAACKAVYAGSIPTLASI